MNMMTMELEEVQRLIAFWGTYGQQLVLTLGILVVGILIIQHSGPRVRKFLAESCRFNPRVALEITTAYYVLLGVILLAAVLGNLGLGGTVTRQILMAIGLGIAALALVLRPYMPSLPFRVGNIIKTGGLIGKVEAITLVNTRLKTFDGLTIYVPNAKILNDYVINYHVTPNRRIKLNVGIRYDQDIVKAKQIIESLMLEDPRVLPTPRPVVYVTELADSSVNLGGRGWVKNPKVWLTQCDLLEKMKYRFDQEGIEVAFPRRDVHLYQESVGDLSGADLRAADEMAINLALSEDERPMFEPVSGENHQ